MVLESLFNPFKAKNKPWEMFFAGFIYALIGLMLSYFVFKEIAGILAIFLIVIAGLPIFFSTLENEEELDMKYIGEWRLLQEHGKVIIFLIFLFLGMIIAMVLAYVSLPSPVVSQIFSLQEKAIINVNQNIQALITGNTQKFDFFMKILVNNFKVLFFCLVFSLLYGTGALFILTWNASVIAVAIGNLIKTHLAQSVSLFEASFVGFFRYMTHGILEIAAYFIIALAGGILSMAIIKHNLQEDKVLIDTLDLVLISVGVLVVAGVVEVYITPVLFS